MKEQMCVPNKELKVSKQWQCPSDTGLLLVRAGDYLKDKKKDQCTYMSNRRTGEYLTESLLICRSRIAFISMVMNERPDDSTKRKEYGNTHHDPQWNENCLRIANKSSQTSVATLLSHCVMPCDDTIV